MGTRNFGWGRGRGANGESSHNGIGNRFQNMRIHGTRNLGNDFSSIDDPSDDSWTNVFSGNSSSQRNNKRGTRGQRGVSSGRGASSSRNSGREYGNKNYVSNDKKDKVQFLTGQDAIEYQQKIEAERAHQYASFDFDAALKEADKHQAEFWSKYPKIIKNVYQEHPELTKMPVEEADLYRAQANDIKVQVPTGYKNTEYNIPIPNPITNFEHAFINYPEIQKKLMEAGFTKPSPIQSQAWPLIMQGHDVIGIAQTGTGKTLAFLLPAYVHILKQAKMPGKKPGANVLILAPTRELAIQIHQEVIKFDYASLRSVCIYGGADRNKQIRDLAEGCNVIIATPGRLDDLVCAKHIDITTITFVILDEADRMLDCGFEPQIRKTLYKIRPDRQTVMTSATWPTGVQRLTNSYMMNPVQIVIGSLDLATVTCVKQEFEFVPNDCEIKFDYLQDFIADTKTYPNLKVIVFTTSKATAAYISSELGLQGEVSCVGIRGDMDQDEREYSIEAMKTDEAQFLIATDVASRGIDIPNITHVVNFDFPRDLEEYVHRVGRTGRAGQSGVALTFFTRRDAKHAEGLVKILEKSSQEIPDELREFAERKNNDYRPRRPYQNGFKQDGFKQDAVRQNGYRQGGYY